MYLVHIIAKIFKRDLIVHPVIERGDVASTGLHERQYSLQFKVNIGSVSFQAVFFYPAYDL